MNLCHCLLSSCLHVCFCLCKGKFLGCRWHHLFPIATRDALLAQSTFVFAPIFVIVWGGQSPGVSVSGWGGVGQEGMVWQSMAGRGRVCRHAIKIAPFKSSTHSHNSIQLVQLNKNKNFGKNPFARRLLTLTLGPPQTYMFKTEYFFSAGRANEDGPFRCTAKSV